MADDKYPSDSAAKFMLRLPDGMRERIAAEAKANNRSMNAEIVGRLQRSLGAESSEGNSSLDLESALDQQRALAKEFRLAADRADGLRAVLAAHLLDKAIQLPDGGMQQLFEDPAARELVEWLAQQDRRGAVFSLLQLFDRATPELIETLQNFAGHLEDLELVRSPVVLTVRGRQVPTDVWTYPLEVRQEEGTEMRRPSANKVIRPIGGATREYLESVSGIVDRRSSAQTITPVQPNRGPESSSNARMRPPKKLIK